MEDKIPIYALQYITSESIKVSLFRSLLLRHLLRKVDIVPLEHCRCNLCKIQLSKDISQEIQVCYRKLSFVKLYGPGILDKGLI
jgi:hypothetical protein